MSNLRVYNLTIETCIVIPCYNEETRLASLKDEYFLFLNKHEDVLLCFINDGSSDATLEQLEILKTAFEKNVEVVSLTVNKGKAEAVRQGVLFCNKKFNHKYIAYLDADLSTSFKECMRLVTYLDSHDEISFVFASRIAKTGAIIKRQIHRFLVGRIISMLISNVLGIEVYDTQCGCKVFKKELSGQIGRAHF